MKRASELAGQPVADLHLRQLGSHYLACVYVDLIKAGKPCLRIENLGPFTAREAMKLARWIEKAFGP